MIFFFKSFVASDLLISGFLLLIQLVGEKMWKTKANKQMKYVNETNDNVMGWFQQFEKAAEMLRYLMTHLFRIEEKIDKLLKWKT